MIEVMPAAGRLERYRVLLARSEDSSATKCYYEPNQNRLSINVLRGECVEIGSKVGGTRDIYECLWCMTTIISAIGSGHAHRKKGISPVSLHRTITLPCAAGFPLLITIDHDPPH